MATPEIKVRLTAEDKASGPLQGFTRSLKEVESSSKSLSAPLSQLKSAFAGVAAAAGVASIAAFVKESIDAADALSKLAQRSGTTVEAFAQLAYAAKLADVSNEQLSGGLQKLAKGMAEAAKGTGTAGEAFAQLGIAYQTTNGELRKTDVVFAEVADKLSTMEDGADKTALAMQLFGKSGAELLPLLNSGASGLKTMAQEARDLGVVMDSETAKAAEAFNDNLTKLGSAVDGVGNDIARVMLPALTDITAAMVEATKDSGLLMAAWVGLGGAANTWKNAAASMLPDLNDFTIAAKGMRRAMVELMTNITYGEVKESWKKDLAAIDAELNAIADKMSVKVQPQADTSEAIAAFVGLSKAALDAQHSIEAVLKSGADTKDLDNLRLKNDLLAQGITNQEAYNQAVIERIIAQARANGATQSEIANLQKLASGHQALTAESLRGDAIRARQTASTKTLTAAQGDLEAAHKREIANQQRLWEESEKAAEALYKQVDADRDALQALTVKNQLLAQGITAQEAVNVAVLEAELASQDYTTATYAEIDALEQRLEIAKQIRTEAAKGDAMQAAQQASARAAEQAVDDWKRASDNISNSLTDALLRGFESGKDAAQNLRDTVVNMFKTMVLRPVIQAVLAPVAGAVAGLLPGAATASTATSLLGSGSSLLSLGGTIAQGFMGAITSTEIGAGIASGFSMAVSGELGAAFAQGSAMLGAGSTAMGLGSMIGAAVPVIGAIAALASAFGLFSDQPDNMWFRLGSGQANNPKDQVSPLASADGPFGKVWLSGWEDLAGDIQAEFSQKLIEGISQTDVALAAVMGDKLTTIGKDAIDGWIKQSSSWVEDESSSASTVDTLKARYTAIFTAVDEALGQAFQSLNLNDANLTENTVAFGQFARAMDASGRSVEAMYGQVKRFGVGLQDGSAAVGNAAEAIRAMEEAAAQNSSFAAYCQSILQTNDARLAAGAAIPHTAAEFANMGANLLAVNDAIDPLSLGLYDLSLGGAEAAASLVQVAGGLDKLIAVTRRYYETFYSAEEQRAYQLQRVQEQLGQIGFAFDLSTLEVATKEQMRAFVETVIAGLDMTTEDGQRTALMLMDLASTLAGLNSSGSAAADALGQVSSSLTGAASAASAAISDYGNPAAQEEYIKEQANMLFDSSNSVTNAIVEAYIAAGKNIQEQLLAANNSMAVDMESNRNQILADYLASKGYFGNESGGISGGGQAYYNGLVDPITGDPMHHTPVYDVMTAEEWAAFSAKPIEELMNLTSYSTELYVRRLFNASNENKKKIDELNKYADEYGQENAQAMYDFMQKRNSSLQAIIDASITDSDFAIRGAAHQPNNYAYIIKELQKRYGDVFNEVLAQVVDPNAIGEVITGYVERGGWDEANQSNWSAFDPIIASQEDLIGKTYQDLLDSGAIFQLPQSIIDQMRQAAIDGNTQYAEVLKLWDEAQQNLIDGFSGSGSDVKTALDRINEALRLNNIKEISAETDEAAKQIARDLASIFAGVDNAISALNNYGGFVLTDAERSDLAKANAQSQVDAFNHTLGLTGDSAIDTAEELRQYVEGLDLSTEAGRDAFKSAMDLVDALKLLGDSAQQTADAAEAAEAVQGDASRWFRDSTELLDLDMASLRETFTQLGLTIPTTAEEYRALMAAQDSSTAAGRRNIAALEAFASIFGDFLQSNLDAAEQAMQAQQDAVSAAQSAVDEARANLVQAYQRESSALQDTISKFDGFARSLREFRQSLLIKDESLSPEARYQAAASAFADISRRAQLGDVEAIDQLQSAAQDFLDASRDYYASSPEYQRDFQSVLAAVEGTEALSTRQADLARQQLTELQQMVAGFDVLDESVLSVRDAVAALESAILALADASSTPAVSVVFPPYKDNNPLPSVLVPGEYAEAPGIQMYSKFATGGLADGWAIVGEQGPELVNFSQPGRVYTASQTAAALGATGNAETNQHLAALVNLQSAANQEIVKRLGAVEAKLTGIETRTKLATARSA